MLESETSLTAAGPTVVVALCSLAFSDGSESEISESIYCLKVINGCGFLGVCAFERVSTLNGV